MIPPPDSWDPPEGPLYFTKKNVPPADRSDPPTVSSHARKCLLITHKKNEYPLQAGTHHSGRLTCGPTKFMGAEGFVNLVNTLVTVCFPSNGHSASSTSDLLAPAAQSSAGRVACSYLPWPAVMPRRPHRPLLLPPLARPSLYSTTPPVILP